MNHVPNCRRVIWGGERWHMALCESPKANYEYALQWSHGDRRYAHALIMLLTKGR